MHALARRIRSEPADEEEEESEEDPEKQTLVRTTAEATAATRLPFVVAVYGSPALPALARRLRREGTRRRRRRRRKKETRRNKHGGERRRGQTQRHAVRTRAARRTRDGG